MNESDKDINGLAFHLADVCGARWERLGPREQAIYRAAAKAGVAAARLIKARADAAVAATRDGEGGGHA